MKAQQTQGLLGLSLPFLVCCCSVAAAFLLDDSHDETLRSALQAIQQLNSKLTEVIDENQRLKELLESHGQTLTKVQTDVTSIGSRVSRDFIWVDDDWVLAFRGTAGIGRPVYDAWTNRGHHDDDPLTRSTLPCGCTTVNGSLPCDRHYRSRLLDSWPSASIDQVKLVLYKNGLEKEHLTFTGTGSDYLSWFSQARLVESTWTDLKSATNLLFFSIAGEVPNLRRFYIDLLHAGCPADVGWLAVKDKMDDVCHWATVKHVPAFLYSPSNRDVDWETDGYSEADVMAVFVKFRSSANLNEECV